MRSLLMRSLLNRTWAGTRPAATGSDELAMVRSEVAFQQSVIADLHTKQTKLQAEVAQYKDLYERAAAGLLGGERRD